MIWPEIWPWVLWAVLIANFRSRSKLITDVLSANEHGPSCICFDCERPFSYWTHTWVLIQ